MKLTIYQCVRGEADRHILSFCIVRNRNIEERHPTGTCGGEWVKSEHNKIMGCPWTAHKYNHTLIYDGEKK